ARTAAAGTTGAAGAARPGRRSAWEAGEARASGPTRAAGTWRRRDPLNLQFARRRRLSAHERKPLDADARELADAHVRAAQAAGIDAERLGEGDDHRVGVQLRVPRQLGHLLQEPFELLELL